VLAVSNLLQDATSAQSTITMRLRNALDVLIDSLWLMTSACGTNAKPSTSSPCLDPDSTLPSVESALRATDSSPHRLLATHVETDRQTGSIVLAAPSDQMPLQLAAKLVQMESNQLMSGDLMTQFQIKYVSSMILTIVLILLLDHTAKTVLMDTIETQMAFVSNVTLRDVTAADHKVELISLEKKSAMPHVMNAQMANHL